MSKWSLLKASIASSSSSSSGLKSSEIFSSYSIHRFNGFDLLNRRKVVWDGFRLQIPLRILIACVDDIDRLILFVRSYLETIDYNECLVTINTYSAGINEFKLRETLYNTIKRGYSIEGIRILKLGIINASNCNNEEFHFDAEICVHINTIEPNIRCCSYYSYDLQSYGLNNNNTSDPSISSPKQIYTREKATNSKIGVDNTGNIRIWTAETMLLYTIMHNKDIKLSFIGKKVLELGGGLTGFCGIGLAVLNLCKSVVVTDGHPVCVSNQKFCIEMNKSKGTLNSLGKVDSHILKWSVNDSFGHLQTILSTLNEVLDNDTNDVVYSNSDTIFQKNAFDVVIASDCTFFKDFHDELIWTIRKALLGNHMDDSVELLQTTSPHTTIGNSGVLQLHLI